MTPSSFADTSAGTEVLEIQKVMSIYITKQKTLY